VNYSGLDTRETFVPEKDYSPETARIIDEEIRSIIDAAYADAERVINENWERVTGIAEALLRHETLSRDDIDRLMRGERIDKPTVADLLAAEAARPAKPTPPAKPDPGPDADFGGAIPAPA